MRRYFLLTLAFLIGAIFWLLPAPEGLSEEGWHLLAIFLSTVFAIISHPLPMGCIALIAVGALAFLKVLPLEVVFSGFGHPVVWLIVCAFFITRGFIKTGLGSRLGYHFMRLFGGKTLGLGYSLVATDVVLAPAIPSATARAGGVILPIVEALAENFDSHPHAPSARKIGSFLIKVVFHSTCISSALFLTAMAANPLVAEMAKDVGIEMTWGSWFLGASVPALISLLLIPYLVYLLFPPEIKETPHAAEYARSELKKMGKMKRNEWLMLGVFCGLIILWALSGALALPATTTALLGLVVLLVTNVLTWKDIRTEEGAWETLIWFSVLIMMAGQLNQLGVTSWFLDVLSGTVVGLSGMTALILLSLFYFYSHYFFASSVAHVSAMFSSFLLIALAMGAPLGLTVFLFAYYSSLFACLTHYGNGPAAVLFGSGYVTISSWWRVGFVVSLVHVLVWTVIGGAWWKFLGIW